MSILSILAFLFIGVLAGLTVSLVQISAGVILVPSLFLTLYFMDFPSNYLMHAAIGTSLAVIFINSIISVFIYQRQKNIIWDVVLSASPGILLGCLLGSYGAHFFSSILLQIFFGFFVCILAVSVLFKKKEAKKIKRYDKTLFTWIGLGFSALSSIFGVGGETFAIPLFKSYNYSSSRAIGTSSAIRLLISFLASTAYIYFGLDEIKFSWNIGYINIPAVCFIGFNMLLFTYLGTKFSKLINVKITKRIFLLAVIIVGILMIFK